MLVESLSRMLRHKKFPRVNVRRFVFNRSTQPRYGRLNLMWVLLLAASGLIVALVAMLWKGPPDPGLGKKKLTLLCAAGLQVPVSEIAAAYEEEYGVHIELQYGGSGSLLNQLQVNKFSDADLYLAADDFYTDKAVTDGYAAETMPLATSAAGDRGTKGF